MICPKVSIIIINFNGKKFLKDLFLSIRNLEYPRLEIILIDNFSSDGGVEYVKEKFTEVKIIENKQNLGFCIANNQEADVAKGKYLFFLNNDTKIDPKAISILVEKMEKNKDIGICGCKMMNYNGERYFHTGIGLDIFGYPTLSSKIFYVEGSALMIRKKLFKKVGGFDSKYFMFHEDIDLCWRVRLLGYKVVGVPEAIVYHFAGGSAGGGEMKKKKYFSTYLRRYYSERNNIRTLIKNYQLLNLFWIMPLYFLINLGEITLFLITLNFKVVYLYFKGYIWNVINLKDTLKERKKIQKFRKISDRQIMKEMYWGSGKLVAFLKVGIPVFK